MENLLLLNCEGVDYEDNDDQQLQTLLDQVLRLRTTCETDIGRNQLNKQNILELHNILRKKGLDPVDLGNSISEYDWKLLQESFRLLRNFVVGSLENQNFIRTETNWLIFALNFLKFHKNNSSEYTLIVIRCALQFLANAMVENSENAQFISSLANCSICQIIIETCDEKCVNYASMSIHLLLKFDPKWVHFMDCNIVEKLIQYTHLEYVMLLMENLAQNSDFLNSSQFSQLTCETRIKFVNVLIQHQELHEKFSTEVLEIFSKKFSESSDKILKSSCAEQLSENLCWEVSTWLDLLCVLSANVVGKERSMTSSMGSSVLISTCYLLKYLHSIDKEGGLDANSTSAATLENLSERSKDAEKIRNHPTFQFKANLIRLLGNICHKNVEFQNKVRETETLQVILDCCKLDPKNPFITEWSILAIRNLCEGNFENQDIVKSLQKLDTEKTLSRNNVTVVDM